MPPTSSNARIRSLNPPRQTLVLLCPVEFCSVRVAAATRQSPSRSPALAQPELSLRGIELSLREIPLEERLRLAMHGWAPLQEVVVWYLSSRQNHETGLFCTFSARAGRWTRPFDALEH